MLYLNKNEKNRFKLMMERGMNTLQYIMTLPMDLPLWKRCASIIAGLARTMKQKEFDILTMISANIMDQLAKDTVDKFAGFKANKNKSLIKMNNGMKQFTKFSRQDHKTAHPFPEIIRNRAVYTGEGWAKDTFVCDGNPIIDLKKWKEFIAENDINKKEWGFTHEAFGLQMSDIWKISSGANQKEMETKLKNGELLIGNDVESSYLSYLLALSEKINPLFRKE